MNVLSLFDGISCGQVALNRARIKYDKYFASEIKKDAIKVTQDNYPDTMQLGDIRNIKGSDLPKIDLLIGGSPCQDFSAANMERLGLQGEKSGLFYEWVRLWKETKPTYFLLENVGSMDSSDANIISGILGVAPVQINSSLVSAQLRDRLYWTNIPGNGTHLFGSYITQPEDKRIMLKDILESGYTDRDKARAVLESDARPLKNPERMLHRFIETGMTTLVFEDKQFSEYAKEKIKHRLGWKQGIGYGYFHDVIRNEKATCLTAVAGSFGYKSETLVIKDGYVRYFTQTELERLQTLPEGYTKALTRNKAAGCIGDGWTVDVIVHIFQGIKPPSRQSML